MVAFDPPHQLARPARGALGHGLRGGEQLVVGHAPPHQPDPLRLGAVEHLAEQHGGGDGLRPGDALAHPRVPAARVEAELQEPGVEPGSLRGQAHVADQGQVHAGADRRAVDGGERGQRRPPDPQEPLVDVAQPRLGAALRRRGQVGQVRPRAERRRLAGDHDGADRGVGLELVEGRR